MSPTSQLLEKARQILQQTERIVQYLEKTGQEEPNFGQDSPVIAFCSEYEALRIPLTSAAEDLLTLVNGPSNIVRELLLRHQDLAAHQVAIDFNYYKAVPLDGSISVPELAKAVGMDVSRTKSVIKHLAAQRYFNEKEPDVFEHNAISALIAKDEAIHAFMAFE